MQNKEDQLLKEYLMLRDELKSADTLKYQIMGIMVGAVGAILVASFNQTNFLVRSLIVLCAYIITIPAYNMLLGNMRRTWRIATYMRVFLECKDALKYIKWETRLSQQRDKAENKKAQNSFSSLAGKNEWLLATLLNSIAGIIALASLTIYSLDCYRSHIEKELPYFPRELYFSWSLILFVLALNLFLNIYNYRQEVAVRRRGKIEQNFYNSWLAIKNSSL
jgi:hypothetical protein